MRFATLTMLVILAASIAYGSEIDLAAAAISGTEAVFTQRFTPKGFKTSQVESGTVTFGTLPMMRWTYSRPEEKVFVFDGQQSWFYVPADKQVTISAIDDQRKSELPFLLLGDAAARDRHFMVRETSSRGTTTIVLQPRSAAALIRTATLAIAPATHLIQRLEYTDREGNRTTFEFSDYRKRTVSADVFRFTPPPGVQVVQAQ
jgi:outer membrane lipoprotein carrier protein